MSCTLEPENPCPVACWEPWPLPTFRAVMDTQVLLLWSKLHLAYFEYSHGHCWWKQSTPDLLCCLIWTCCILPLEKSSSVWRENTQVFLITSSLKRLGIHVLYLVGSLLCHSLVFSVKTGMWKTNKVFWKLCMCVSVAERALEPMCVFACVSVSERERERENARVHSCMYIHQCCFWGVPDHVLPETRVYAKIGEA